MMTKYFVLSQGLIDGPFEKREAVEFLYKLCDVRFAPPERLKSTVLFSDTNGFQDVVKYYDKTLNGNYVGWYPDKLSDILSDLDNVS